MAPSSASAPLKDARGALEQLTNAIIRDRQVPYLLLYSDTITPLFPTNGVERGGVVVSSYRQGQLQRRGVMRELSSNPFVRVA